MNSLLAKYKQYIRQEESESYTKQKLKLKLEKKCPDDVIILPAVHKQPEMVISKDLQIHHILNTAASLKESL
jgi:hypothetical protein